MAVRRIAVSELFNGIMMKLVVLRCPVTLGVSSNML